MGLSRPVTTSCRGPSLFSSLASLAPRTAMIGLCDPRAVTAASGGEGAAGGGAAQRAALGGASAGASAAPRERGFAAEAAAQRRRDLPIGKQKRGHHLES